MTPEAADVPPEEAARLLGIALPTLRRLIDQGVIPSHGPAGALLIARAALLAYRDRHAAIRRAALAELARWSAAHDA
jgi:excisionase family DNA binding protein